MAHDGLAAGKFRYFSAQSAQSKPISLTNECMVTDGLTHHQDFAAGIGEQSLLVLKKKALRCSSVGMDVDRCSPHSFWQPSSDHEDACLESWCRLTKGASESDRPRAFATQRFPNTELNMSLFRSLFPIAVSILAEAID